MLAWDAVFEELEDGVCLLAPELHIVRVNPAFAELIGEPAEKLIGRPGHDVLESLGRRGVLPPAQHPPGIPPGGSDTDHQQDQSRSQVLDKLLEQSDPRDGYEYDPTIESQRLRTRLIPLHETDSELYGYLLILRDSTGTVSHEREIARAEQLARLGELAASLAHEIRNPLAGIQGAVDILIGRRDPNDPERSVLEGVRHEVVRIDDTIRKLLSHARPREANTRLALINDPVRRAVILARSHAAYLKRSERRNIRILFDVAPVHLTLLIDELQIEDAVLNLILNAVESIEENGAIRVSVRHQEAQDDQSPAAVIEIEDTGRGISEENLNRIFAPFYTTSPHGTGLGLPAVRRIVRSHGGTIDVTSTLGRGSLFRIRLPIHS